MIMNVYSFSSYEDFHAVYVLLVIFYYNYENNFDLIKSEKNYLYFFYLYCRFQNLAGFIHVGTILLSNLIIYLYFNKIDLKIIKKLFILSFFCFSQFILWQYHVINLIYTGND